MKDLTSGDEGKAIWNFTVPMLIGNVFQQSYNIIDSVIVGRVAGKSALAAVGASFPIIFLLVSLIIGSTTGFSILIAQSFGAKDMAKVRRIVGTTYVFIFIASLGISVAGIIFARDMLELLNTPPEIFSQALLFLRITFSGFIFLFGYISTSALLRGLGDSKTPLYFLIFSAILNAALAVLFVKQFGWGVAGSAWATILAQGTALLAICFYLNRTHEVLRLHILDPVFDRDILIRSLKIGLPSGVQQVMVSAGMMALTRVVNGFGTDAVAAYTAAGRVDMFAVMPAMSLSVAISTFVGQNIGAGRMERVKRGLRNSLYISCLTSVLITLTVVIFGGRLISTFNPDPVVVTIGSHYLTIVGGFYIVFSAMFVINGALRGAGDTFIPMIVSILSLWLIRIPLSVFLSRSLATDGIWWGTPVAWLCGLAASSAYYYTGRWKRLSVVAMPQITKLELSPEEEPVGRNAPTN